MPVEPEMLKSPPYAVEGQVDRARGLLLTCRGLEGFVAMGDTCVIGRRAGAGTSATDLLAEVVGIDQEGTHLLPYDEVAGVGRGATVRPAAALDLVRPGRAWLGRVLDCLARPMDHRPPPPAGGRSYRLQGKPPAAHLRRPLGPRIDLGVRALNLFTPCRRGQRLGIFAGAGVGKSTLLGMLAEHAEADALVLGLVGERGHELHHFLDQVLGAAGRERAVVVVATSDMPPMLRRRAALLTMTIAEALRDEGLEVMCLIDSVTRYAMALREIHLAAGEPPTSKGYPPGVFAELPQLLERAGPGPGRGSITALFTVLVEGDDLTDPVADAVRGILDGHIILDRDIAEGGRFPAVDVLRSLSRTAPEVYAAEERPLVTRARQLLKAHADVADLLQLGAYQPGRDVTTDEALRLKPALDALLSQPAGERASLADDVARLQDLLAGGCGS